MTLVGGYSRVTCIGASKLSEKEMEMLLPALRGPDPPEELQPNGLAVVGRCEELAAGEA